MVLIIIQAQILINKFNNLNMTVDPDMKCVIIPIEDNMNPGYQ